MSETTGTVTRWRRKLVEAEAIQWTGDNLEAVRAFAGAEHVEDRGSSVLHVLTSGGRKAIWRGYWVGREDGALFCSTAKTFAHNYESAEPGSGWPGRGWEYAGRDSDGNLRLKHAESGGEYIVLPVEDL